MKTFFRILWPILFVFIAGMFYWSSLLVEQDLKSLKREIADIRKEFTSSSRDQLSNNENMATFKPAPRPYIDDKYPNLLTEDVYYSEILPKVLGDNFEPKYCRREATLGRPDHLHPFNNFSDIAQMILRCSGTLGQLHFGKYETYAPSFAIKIEKRPRTDIPEAFEYWIHLRENLFWENLQQKHFPDDLTLASHFLKRHPVNADDFKFFYDAIMNPFVSEPKAGALRRAYSDIEAFEIKDPLTFVVRWKADDKHQIKYTSFGLTCGLQPLPSFVYQYFADGKKIIDNDDYRRSSIWAQNFSNHFAKNIIISCGAYTFAGMNEEGIKFKRNNNFYDPYAALVDEYQVYFKESVDAIWQDFKAQKIDLCTLSPNQFVDYKSFLNSSLYKEQMSQGLKINELEYVDRSYYYIGWNQKKPFFQSQKIRKALSYAIDRRRIIDQNLNHMGIMITGPFFPYSPSYDLSIVPLAHDPDEAIRLLEEEGWHDKDGDGIREKMINGEKIPFKFTLIYYVKNMSTKVICDYVATTLRQIGIECSLWGVDLPDLSRNFEDKTFDALFLGWGLGTPPEDPEQLWHSALATQKGTSNAIGFCNKEADSIIEKLHYEYDVEKRNTLYHRFHKIIYDEAPYTFLYSPKRKLLYRDYVKNLFIPKEKFPNADIAEPDFSVIFIEK